MNTRIQDEKQTFDCLGAQVALADDLPSDRERTKMSVLMCDLVGSTELAYSLDTDEFYQLMLAYYRICSSRIEEYGGSVIQYVGDAVLAVFDGNKCVRDDPAIEGTRAGVRIIDYLAVHAVTVDAGCHQLKVRVTVASGDGMCADLRCSNGLKQQAVFGRLPFLADRLKTHTEPNTMLVDYVTAAAISRTHILEPMEVANVKGVPFAVPSWKVSCGEKAFVLLQR